MKIVINIPEYLYKEIVNDEEYGIERVRKAVINGKPLPKNCGRLIDADELIQDIKDDSQLCYFNSESERIIHDKMVDFAIDRITDAATIISTESEEEKNGKIR